VLTEAPRNEGLLTGPDCWESLDRSVCSDSHPGSFALGEMIPCVHCTGGYVGPRAGLDAWEERPRPQLICLVILSGAQLA